MPRGWSALDRRARIAALVALGVLALTTVAATWYSMRFGQPSTPVYGSPSSAPASVWTWDGSTYSLVPTGGAGPRSNDVDMAYDRARGALVLWDHGCASLVMGFTGGCASRVDETWTWDGGRWSARSPRSAPREVGPGAMLYDLRLGRVVYVNGSGLAWSWSGSDWEPLATAGGPAAAPTLAIGYDEGRGLLVLVRPGSTWTWDGGAWAETRGGIDPAEARADAHLAYDRGHGQLVYVGSRRTWTWDGARWEGHEQPPIAAGTLGYDAARRTVMLVQQDPAACDRTACRTTTWTWDSRSWTQLDVDRVPMLPLTRSGAFPPPMAFDEARGVMVLLASAS